MIPLMTHTIKLRLFGTVGPKPYQCHLRTLACHSLGTPTLCGARLISSKDRMVNNASQMNHIILNQRRSHVPELLGFDAYEKSWKQREYVYCFIASVVYETFQSSSHPKV